MTIYDAMPLAMIESYINQIPAIIAERKIDLAESAMLPWCEHPGELLENLYLQAYGSLPKQPATPGLLKYHGIGVHHVGKR